MGVPPSARGGSCTRPHALPARPAFDVGISRLASFLRVLASVLLLSLVAFEVAAQEIRYLYDDLGRLVGVVDPQGNAAEYVYDAVGNILQIRRVNVTDFPGPVAITFFDPKRGEVGTPVTHGSRYVQPSSPVCLCHQRRAGARSMGSSSRPGGSLQPCEDGQ